ncbi:MAG: DUF5056 domain-containing protein [Prevotella sp.]|nr:DUF5056 domain-containing protein [Prevotella sp.]
MTDKDNILIEDFFKQAAQQQIEDNGFTERVMMNLPESEQEEKAHRLSLLWTLFCVVVSVVLFFVFGGWEALKASIMVALHGVLTSLSVFLTTAPTTEVPLNPVVLLLVAAFVLIYLPYRTYRKLSAVL